MDLDAVLHSLGGDNFDKGTKKKISYLLEELADHHEETYKHSLRVALLTRDLGIMQKFGSESGMYAVLHDIGKLKVPVEILSKTDFQEGDFEITKIHPLEGYKILTSEGLPYSAWIALTHHRYQPTRYPTEEQMAKIPFPIKNASQSNGLSVDKLTKLIAIADSYDAMNRPNNKFNGKIPSLSEKRSLLINQFPCMSELINSAYNRGIFLLE